MDQLVSEGRQLLITNQAGIKGIGDFLLVQSNPYMTLAGMHDDMSAHHLRITISTSVIDSVVCPTDFQQIYHSVT